jgi:hypothetical protein
MLQKQANKDSDTKQEASARKVTTSKYHRKRDGHGNDTKSRSRRRCHNSLEKYTRRDHSSSRLGINPSVSHVRRQRKRDKGDILQGEIRKIKPHNFNGEHRKG